MISFFFFGKGNVYLKKRGTSQPEVKAHTKLLKKNNKVTKTFEPKKETKPHKTQEKRFHGEKPTRFSIVRRSPRPLRTTYKNLRSNIKIDHLKRMQRGIMDTPIALVANIINNTTSSKCPNLTP